jgi:hypothetical protein
MRDLFFCFGFCADWCSLKNPKVDEKNGRWMMHRGWIPTLTPPELRIESPSCVGWALIWREEGHSFDGDGKYA